MFKATWNEDRILHISYTIFSISSHLRWLTRLLPYGAALSSYLGEIIFPVASGALISQPPLFLNRPKGNEWPFPLWGKDWDRKSTHMNLMTLVAPRSLRSHRGVHTACVFSESACDYLSISLSLTHLFFKEIDFSHGSFIKSSFQIEVNNKRQPKKETSLIFYHLLQMLSTNKDERKSRSC